MAPIISLRSVSKSYREGGAERFVLRGIDATVEAGEHVALLGKSGSGKSTLLNLISGIDLPTEGQIEVAGRLIGALSEEERTLFRREHVGFIFQSFNLIATLTVEENLLLPLELRGVERTKARSEARAMLEELGLTERGATFPDVLSGGEQQRVAVARALIHRPSLCLADEPTGNLDQETGRQVLDLIDRLTRKAGRTVVVVTHDREAAKRADRVLVIDHGALVLAPRAAESSSGIGS